jgi:epoxyqueuosine reductase QueG
MVEDRPVWQNYCEKCLACIQWYPKEAIQFKDVTFNKNGRNFRKKYP